MSALVDSLFKITEHALGIYKTTQSRVYLERVLQLKKVYRSEQNKEDEKRNHAVMDNAINELCVLTESIADFGQQIPTD